MALLTAALVPALLVVSPSVQAIHGTSVCDPTATTQICFRVSPVSRLAFVVASAPSDPTATLHVSQGLLHVDLAVDYVEVAFVAVSVTGPGQPADWSAYEVATTFGVGTDFIPGAVTSTPVDLVDPNVGIGLDSVVQLWNVRYQVWGGSQKLLDVPGVACTC